MVLQKCTMPTLMLEIKLSTCAKRAYDSGLYLLQYKFKILKKCQFNYPHGQSVSHEVKFFILFYKIHLLFTAESWHGE